MTNRTMISQCYWPSDTPQQTNEKVDRATRALNLIARDQEQTWTLVIRKHVKPKSPEQSGYLWGVVYVVMSDTSGFEREELHDLMCGSYFGTRVVEVMGVKKRKPLRTTTTNELGESDPLGVEEMGQFMDFVIRQAALHMDLAIPKPSTQA